MYRMRIQTQIGKSQSPARSIASPGLIRGLSKLGSKECLSPLNIKNKKPLPSPRMSSGRSSAIQSELADEYDDEDLMKQISDINKDLGEEEKISHRVSQCIGFSKFKRVNQDGELDADP